MKTIRLNRQNIHMLSGSPGGNGFTRKQVELLGFTWPPQKGWLSSLIGKEIPVELYQEVAKHYRPKWAALNDPLGKVELNGDCGFPRISFKDYHGNSCHLEMSTAIVEDDPGHGPGGGAIWLGNDRQPMYLDRTTARRLVQHITRWLETSEF